MWKSSNASQLFWVNQATQLNWYLQENIMNYIESNEIVPKVQSPHTKKYDLLAVCPITSAAFQVYRYLFKLLILS